MEWKIKEVSWYTTNVYQQSQTFNIVRFISFFPQMYLIDCTYQKLKKQNKALFFPPFLMVSILCCFGVSVV